MIGVDGAEVDIYIKGDSEDPLCLSDDPPPTTWDPWRSMVNHVYGNLSDLLNRPPMIAVMSTPTVARADP